MEHGYDESTNPKSGGKGLPVYSAGQRGKLSLIQFHYVPRLPSRPGVCPALRPPLPLQKTLAIPFNIFQHAANTVSKYIDAPIIWVELQMVADNGQQPVQARVHTGRSAYQPYPLPSFPGSVGPCRFHQLFPPKRRLILCSQASAPSALSFCCTPGRCGTAPATIPPPLSTSVGKLLSTPLAGFLYMRLIHRQQIAKPAAVSSASLFPCQGCSTKRTFPGRRFF